MMKTAIFLVTTFLITSNAFGQPKDEDATYKKHFIGSTAFMLANLTEDSPNYYQLNYGYRMTPKDVISIELITWEYKGPLGRPYDKVSENTDYPGHVQAFGVGFAYKRFLWESLYAAIHMTALHQNYFDKNRKKIQSGFQLFNTARIGYQFKFFDDDFFIEPSVAATFWPINTNLPQSFQVEEDKWDNYFWG